MRQKRSLINYQGAAGKISCLGCAREKGIITIGSIVRSKYFDAHQDYEIPIPGFIIISARRHIQSIDEFTVGERADFIQVLYSVRSAMRKVLGVKIVYLIQEEDTSHHFHIWLFPRYAWMKKKFGTKIQSVYDSKEYARNKLRTKENIKKIEKAIIAMKRFLDRV